MKSKQLEFEGHPYAIAYLDPSPQHPSWFSFEDESTVRAAIWKIAPGDVVFDVGAAYGSYSLTALAAGAKRVFAWSPMEASPPECELLEESLILNDWQDRCEIMVTGAYDRTGWLNPGTQAFCETDPADKTGLIKVQTLDDWRKEHTIPAAQRYWLKLDVEGAEVHVLSGARKLIAELRPNITVENHNFKRATLEQEVRDLVLSMGYIEVSTTPYHEVSHSLYVPSKL